MANAYRIADLATRLTVPVETIRYYERERRLPKPARSDGNYRLYTERTRALRGPQVQLKWLRTRCDTARPARPARHVPAAFFRSCLARPSAESVGAIGACSCA